MSKTLQPILILSSYELGKVESVIWLEEKMENACPLEGSRDEEPQNKMKQNLLFHRIFKKWIALHSVKLCNEFCSLREV